MEPEENTAPAILPSSDEEGSPEASEGGGGDVEPAAVDPQDYGGEGDLIPPLEAPIEIPPDNIIIPPEETPPPIEPAQAVVEIPPLKGVPESSKAGAVDLATLRARSIASRQARKRAKLDKIITLARKRGTPITNRLVPFIFVFIQQQQVYSSPPL